MENQNTNNDAKTNSLSRVTFSGENIVRSCKFLDAFLPSDSEVHVHWTLDTFTFAVRDPDTGKTLNINLPAEIANKEELVEIFFPLKNLQGISKLPKKSTPEKTHIRIDPTNQELFIDVGITKRFNYSLTSQRYSTQDNSTD